MSGPVRGGSGVLGSDLYGTSSLGMKGKQSCSQLRGSTAGGPCCPQSSVGRLKISVSAGRDTPWPSSSP